MNIEFVSTFPEILSDETVLPKTTNKYIPEWYKKMPLTSNSSEITGRRTVKACPAISDLFGLGYVIPAWSDIAIYYENGVALARIGQREEIMKTHENEQFLNHADHNFLGKQGKFVFKLDNPWKIITPKGWSVLQLPLLYNFNEDFSVLGGVIDTDIWHQTNLQIMYYGTKEIIIPKGTPLVQYIPFKREKNKLTIRSANDKDRLKFRDTEYRILSKFSKGYVGLRKIRYKEEN
jgi:hypothetical protein